MPTRFVWLIVVIALLPHVGFSWTDVNFQLDTTALIAADQAGTAGLEEMQLSERSWCAANVEAAPSPIADQMLPIWTASLQRRVSRVPISVTPDQSQQHYFEPDLLPLTWYLIRETSTAEGDLNFSNPPSSIDFRRSPARPCRLDGMCVAL